MRVSSVIPIFLALASLSTNVLAQENTRSGGSAPANTNSPQPTRNQNPPATTNPPANDNPPEEEEPTDDTPASQTNRNSNQSEDSPPSRTTNPPANDDEEEEEPPSRTTPSNVVITPTGNSDSDDDDDAPALSSGVTISSNPDATGSGDDAELPPPKYTPPDNGRYTIPDYPPPAVPDTKNAPYMQKSDLPEGTVFIAVGGALGLIGLIAFAWRMIVAWQLRRSIRQANLAASADSKAGLLGRYDAPSTAKKSFYSAGAGSSVSLDHLHNSRTGLGQTPNASLFFSPTASTGTPVHANRGSAYLPAGYYAPAASPGLGFNQSRDSLPRPRPVTRDSPAHGTPPASPLLLPQARRPSPGQGHHQSASVSSRTSLGLPPSGRTPSTYLEDMLDIPFPEDNGMTAEQVKRSSKRKSGHSYSGYNGSGSRR